jgi:hypothetical protein
MAKKSEKKKVGRPKGSIFTKPWNLSVTPGQETRFEAAAAKISKSKSEFTREAMELYERQIQQK